MKAEVETFKSKAVGFKVHRNTETIILEISAARVGC